MGYIIRKNGIYGIQRQRSNVFIPLLKDRWYLCHKHEGADVACIFKFFKVREHNNILRIVVSECYYSDGEEPATPERGQIWTVMFNHTDLENTTLAPDGLDSQLEIILYYT